MFLFFWNACRVFKTFVHTFFRIDIIAIFSFSRNPKKDHTKHFKKMSTFDKNKTVFFLDIFSSDSFQLLEKLRGVVPYPEEVLVSSEDGGLCVGLNVGVHVGLSHPRRKGLRRAEAERGGVLVVLGLGLSLLFVVIYNNK